MSAVVPVLLIVLLVAAALHDVATRMVPDWISAVVAIGGGFQRSMAGPGPMMASSMVALVLFAGLFLAFAARMLGGGDVKLATAVAFGLAPLQSLHFVVATVMVGGAVAVLYLALSFLPALAYTPARPSLPGRIYAIERRRIRRRSSLPYATAIAAGGTLQLLQNLGT
jgi:prepilin peptidase CpaA